jgi:hypothetical protein
MQLVGKGHPDNAIGSAPQPSKDPAMKFPVPHLFTALAATLLTAASLTAVTTITTVMGTTEAHAQSNKRVVKPPKTTPIPAPIVNVTRVRPDVAELTIPPSLSTAGTRQEYQVISGPNAEGSASSITLGGTILVGFRNVIGQYPIELQPNADYYVRVRNTKTSIDFSPWTTVFFRTPGQFDERPNPPANLRISNQTDTRVTLMWDDAGANLLPNIVNRYEFFINAIRTPIPQCGGPYTFCTEADYRTITISRPTPGTTLAFGVTTRDANLNRSEISTLAVN